MSAEITFNHLTALVPKIAPATYCGRPAPAPRTLVDILDATTSACPAAPEFTGQYPGCGR